MQYRLLSILLVPVFTLTTMHAAPATQPAPAAPSTAPSTAIDRRTLVSKSDLVYDKPVERSEEGIPLGNGRMGSLVWTSGSTLKLQINRVDVQPMNKDTNSFVERNSDYMGGCGFVDLELARGGPSVFSDDGTKQHLSVYDGLMDIKARGLSARLLAWTSQDVMAIELDDQRDAPEPLQVNLRMLRNAAASYGTDIESIIKNHIVSVRTRSHTAVSQLHIRDGRILLTQEFKEGKHVARSAVAIAMLGRASQPSFANETEVRLVQQAGRGRSLVLIASAASLETDEDVAASALKQLEAAEKKAFNGLAADNAAWWHAFWDRGAIALHSADGVADYVALHYQYFLYIMGSTSRGAFPPKFNGMIWNTDGDQRAWGAEHWFANLSCYYEALFATNRLDLLDPMFSMYSGMYDAAATAARQQWGSQGIFIPETTWYDGLATLPDDIAAEMRDLYLLRKPWDQRSEKFKAFALTMYPYSSRWNWMVSGNWVNGVWVPTERGSGPYGPVTHNLGTTAKVAYLYWRKYEYTLDDEWLRTRAYPMIKGAAELYRNFPNFKKDSDGTYHIHYTNSNESVYGAQDSDEDLSAMHAIFAVAIRASEKLGEDAQLRAQWQEVLGHLSPLVTSDTPDALKPDNYNGPRVFVRGRKPITGGRGFTPDGNSLPMWFFDLVNPESPDRETLAIANATFDRAPGPGAPGPRSATEGANSSAATPTDVANAVRGVGPNTPVGVLSKLAIAGTTLGRVDATRYLIPNQIRTLTAERSTAYKGGQPLANRMTLREGPQALDAQRLGRAADALQIALLQSGPGTPGGDSVIRLFSAWPPEWDAQFTLRARGAFVVTASQHGGKIDPVELRSEKGATCRLHNPWGTSTVTLTRNGKRWQQLKGALLTFNTSPGDVIVVAPR